MSSYGEVTASQIASQQPAPTTMQNSAVGNGDGANLPVTGYATAILDIVASVPMGGGTTINFVASVDDTTWVPILGSLAGTTTTGTTTTEPGNWSFSVAGFKSLRARISAYSAGTITVKGYSSVLTSAGPGGSGGASGNVNLNQVAGNSTAVNNGSVNNGTIRVCIADDSAGTIAASQSGTWNINDVSGTVSLPTGAATEAKQPALGTAGSASSDVLSVQGIASMTALKVDGSGSTQPVSGSVTANAGTNLNTSALALESGGNLATLADAVASSKIQSNTAQINGVTPSMNNGSAGTGVQRITICDDSTGQIAQTASKVPSSTTMQNAVSSSGNGTSLNVQGFATGVISVTGTYSATVSFEASLDDSVWVAIMGTQTGTTTSATSTTTNGDWVFNVAGYKSLRTRVTWTSGTSVTCKGYVSVVAGSSSSGGGVSSNVNLNQVGGTSTATGNGTVNSGVQRVTIASDSAGQTAQTASIMPSATTMQNAATSNGNGTSLAVTGYATAVLSITGFGAKQARINFEGSVDDTTWVVLIGTRASSMNSAPAVWNSPFTDSTGDWTLNIAGYKSVRARISDYSSGSITVKGYASVLSKQANAYVQSAPIAMPAFLNSSGDLGWYDPMQTAATANGNGIAITTTGYASATLYVSGSFSANINFEGTVDGGNWFNLTGYDVTTGRVITSGGGANLPSSPFAARFNAAGLSGIRARISSYASGSITVIGAKTVMPHSPSVNTDSSGNVVLGASSRTNLCQSDTVLSSTNGIYSNLLQANAALSSTNGIYSNMLQGNAALSSTNGIFSNILQANTALSSTNQLPVRPSADGTNPVDSSHPFPVYVPTFVVPGTDATHLGKEEDAAHATGDTGVYALAVRDDGSTTFTSTNGDYSPVAVTKTGAVKVQVEPSRKATYIACSAYTTPATSTQDICQISAGSKTVKILFIQVVWAVLAAGNGTDLYLKKRDTLNTSGTSSPVTLVPLDAGNDAASASVVVYTANPTSSGEIGNLNLVNAVMSSVTPKDEWVLWDSKVTGQPITLRASTNDCVAIDCEGVKPVGTSQKFSVNVIFTEE